MKNKHKITILISMMIVIVVFVVILLRPYIIAILLGFNVQQPNSVELIKYDQLTGTGESILITEREEITELYDTIRYANVKKIQFDAERLETDGDWTIILHFENEDIHLNTQGEGIKESIYFCKYLNQNSPDDFIEVWLDNSMLMDILSEYE